MQYGFRIIHDVTCKPKAKVILFEEQNMGLETCMANVVFGWDYRLKMKIKLGGC